MNTPNPPPPSIPYFLDLSASPTLTTVREIAGDQAAHALIEARGGTTVWLPRGLTPHCPLVQIVGMEAAARIVFHFGTDRALGIPTGRGLGHCRRLDHQRIETMARAGWRTPDIARECRCSTRQVRKILARAGITFSQSRPTPPPRATAAKST